MENYICFKCPDCEYNNIKPNVTLKRCSVLGDAIENYVTWESYHSIIAYENRHSIKIATVDIVPPCHCVSTNLTKFKLNDKVYNSLLDIILFLYTTNIDLETCLQLTKIQNKLGFS